MQTALVALFPFVYRVVIVAVSGDVDAVHRVSPDSGVDARAADARQAPLPDARLLLHVLRLSGDLQVCVCVCVCVCM